MLFAPQTHEIIRYYYCAFDTKRPVHAAIVDDADAVCRARCPPIMLPRSPNRHAADMALRERRARDMLDRRYCYFADAILALMLLLLVLFFFLMADAMPRCH